MAMKILTLDGLEDSRLCDLIAQLLQTIRGVSNAKIDFLSQKLTLEIEGRRTDEVIQDVVSMLKKNIPSVTIKRTEVAREIEKPHVRFPDMSRYDYMREEVEEEEEEEEIAVVAEEPEEDQSEPSESSFTLSRNSSRFLIGIGASLICIVFANIFSDNDTWAMILSVVSLIVSTVFMMMFQSNKIQGNWWGSTVIVLAASVGVGATGSWVQAAGAVAIYQVAIFFVTLIYDYLGWNIDKIVDIQPEQLSRQRESTVENVSWKKIMPGDKVLIPPGKTIAFSGEILEGESTVNRFLLTGSETPVDVAPGDMVACGEKNLRDQIIIRVNGFQDKTMAFKLRQSMRDRHLSDTEVMIDTKKKVTIFTLISFAVVVLGGLLLYIFSEDTSWISTAFILLAITAPCGATASVLAAQISSLGGAVRNGIMIKGGKALRNLSKVTMVLTSHAGVLTQGTYHLKDVWTTPDFSKDDILRMAACVELESDDPISKAITEELMNTDAKQGELPTVSMRESLKGMGVRAMIDKKIVLFGSGKYMKAAEIEVPPNENGDICLYMAQRDVYIGALIFEDAVRPGVEEMSQQLRSLEVEKIGILTGRDSMVARAVGEQMGADVVYAEQSDNEKLKTLDVLMEEREEKKSLMYVGDDESLDLFIAPCTRVAMGQDAIKILFESADVMVPSGEPIKVAQAVGYGKGMTNAATSIVSMIIAIKSILFVCVVFLGLSFMPVIAINGLLSVFIAFKAMQLIN